MVTHGLCSLLQEPVAGNDGLLKGLDFEVVVVPYPNECLPSQLGVETARAAKMLQNEVMGVNTESDSCHALDRIGEGGMFGGPMWRAKEYHTRRGKQDPFEWPISLNLG